MVTLYKNLISIWEIYSFRAFFFQFAFMFEFCSVESKTFWFLSFFFSSFKFVFKYAFYVLHKVISVFCTLIYTNMSIWMIFIHTLTVHEPPFLHGCVAHGCSMISQRSPDKPSAQVQRNLSGAVFSQVPPCLQGSWVPQ